MREALFILLVLRVPYLYMTAQRYQALELRILPSNREKTPRGEKCAMACNDYPIHRIAGMDDHYLHHRLEEIALLSTSFMCLNWMAKLAQSLAFSRIVRCKMCWHDNLPCDPWVLI